MLCLVREEVRELAARLPQEDPELGAAVQDRGRLLAPAALAFLQRLMAVPEPLQRCVALTQGMLPMMEAIHARENTHGGVRCVAA